MMTSAAVAKIGVDAMLKNKSSVVAGLANAAMAFSTRFAPRSLNAELGYKIMKP
jgi:short-subunit dehydrogenase